MCTPSSTGMGQKRHRDAFDNAICHGTSAVACQSANAQIYEYPIIIVLLAICFCVFPQISYSKNKTSFSNREFFYSQNHQYQKKDSIIFTHLSKNINTQYDDYDPMIGADSSIFVFTSTRPSHGKNGEDIYISMLENGNFNKAKNISNAINTSANEGSPFISYDGKTIYFSACGRKKDSQGSCDIYYCSATEKGFSRPKNMGTPICTPYWDAHPSVSADGRYLYFSSARPGGKGGKDIWVSEKKNNIWCTPEPISTINTKEDEVSPFIHMDGRTLYFSSSGHDTHGRLDFFVTHKKNDGTWSTPQNLGNEINDEKEQYSLRVDRSGRYGFFATDAFADSEGGLDIYIFSLPKIAKAEAVYFINGNIKSSDNEAIADAQIYISVLDEEKDSPLVRMDENGFSVMAISGVKYKISVLASGYAPHFSIVSSGDRISSLSYDIILEKINSGMIIPLTDVHFPTDGYDLDSISLSQVRWMALFLLENEDMSAEISGHTDNVGSSEYNAVLSEKRAKSVLNVLVEMGVDEKRLSAHGYGDRAPLFSNDSEDGRAKNRRTEIKILTVKKR